MPCAGRRLECVVGVGIGQPEIDDLYVLTVVSYEYVLWLKIPMDYLFAVHIVQPVTNLAMQLPTTGCFIFA